MNSSQPQPIEGQIILEPFARAFREVILAEALRTVHRQVGKRKLFSVAERLDAALCAELGHPLHPAITCFALRVCCHFHYQWVESLSSQRQWRRQRTLIDRAWRIISALEEFYGVWELKARCYG